MSKHDLKVEVAALSETGLRDENQDWMNWSSVSWGECYIVADGVGGNKGGAVASRMTVEGFQRHLNSLPIEWPFEKALQEAARRTNEEVYRSAHSGDPETENMGSTVVVALVSDGKVQVGHIGDSRVYLFRKGRLQPLTKDHTGIQQMVDAGILTASEARVHPDANVLSRAVGSRPEVEIEIGKPIKLENGDGLLLCSDGLNGYVEDEQIEKLVRQQADIQRIPQELVELALKSGGDDNVTVQFIRYGKASTNKRRQTVKLSVSQSPGGAAAWNWIWQPWKNHPAWVVATVISVMVLGIILFYLKRSPEIRGLSDKMANPPTPNAETRPDGGAGVSSSPPLKPPVSTTSKSGDQAKPRVLILIRPGNEKKLADAVKERIQNKFSGFFVPELLNMNDDVSPLPNTDAIYYYPEDDEVLRKASGDLSTVLKTLPGFEKIAKHRGSYKTKTQLQEFAKRKAGDRHLLIILPPPVVLPQPPAIRAQPPTQPPILQPRLSDPPPPPVEHQ